MTEDYHRDFSALKLMIKAVEETNPQAGSDEANALKTLKDLLKEIRPLAQTVDSKAIATKSQAKSLKKLQELDGRYSVAFERKFNGLKAAGADSHLSPLDCIFTLLEDGHPGSIDAATYLQRLRDALGAGRPGRSDKQAKLSQLAEEAGAAADALIAKVIEEDAGTKVMLLASTLDALLPVAESIGLPPDAYRTLHALRHEVAFMGGGGPGSGYWPSNYVYSSSSSGGSSSTSSAAG